MIANLAELAELAETLHFWVLLKYSLMWPRGVVFPRRTHISHRHHVETGLRWFKIFRSPLPPCESPSPPPTAHTALQDPPGPLPALPSSLSPPHSLSQVGILTVPPSLLAGPAPGPLHMLFPPLPGTLFPQMSLWVPFGCPVEISLVIKAFLNHIV